MAVDCRIQLIEFLVSDYLLPWSLSQDFDTSTCFFFLCVPNQRYAKKNQVDTYTYQDNSVYYSCADLLEEWVTSVFHARKALELLESRNALYVLYMDRVVGDLTRQMGQVSFLQKLRPDTVTKLFG